MSETVGDRIRKLTKEYCKIYDDTCDVPALKDNARNIALHDPIIEKHVFENVVKEVTKYIDRREK